MAASPPTGDRSRRDRRAFAGRASELVWAGTVGLVLADSAVVTLALPDILRRFDTTVLGVSWVLTAFNLVLALSMLPAAWLATRHAAADARAVWSAGMIGFATASLVCAIAPTETILILGRCAQAVAGACVIAGAIELLARSRGSHARAAAVWGAAGVVGLAVGPAAGGLLTELISWEAIFAVQVPVAALVVVTASAPAGAVEQGTPGRPRLAPELALGLISAALTGALFLLVIMLTEGWKLSPLEAAVVVSAMPVATAVARRLTRGVDHSTAVMAAGAVALAGGLAALGLVPRAAPVWTLAPQAFIGVGIALALPGLTARALAGADPAGRRAAGTIAARHLGIVLGLVVLTPIFSSQLADQQDAAERSGTALILDARLSPATKIALGDAIADRIERAGGRLPDLAPAFDALTPPAEARPEYERLEARLAEEVDKAATHAFSLVFLIAAAIALLAVVPIAAGGSVSVRRSAVAVVAALASSAGLGGAYLALGGASYEPLAVADPCAQRPVEELRRSSSSVLERIALSTLDGAACRLRVPREELAIALTSEEARAEFAAEHRLSEEAIDDAVRSGLRRAIDDAVRLDMISSLEATLLRQAVDVLPVPVLMDALRSSAGKSILEVLTDLLRRG
jgi:predicted MFS family arabinose efflux permease